MSGFSDFGDFYSAVGFPSGSPADSAVPLPQSRPANLDGSNLGVPPSGVLNTSDAPRMPPPPSSVGEVAREVARPQGAPQGYDFQGRLKNAIQGLDMSVDANGRVVTGQRAQQQQQGQSALAQRAKQMLQMGVISQDQHDRLIAAATNPNPSAGPSLAWGQ